MEAIPTFSWRCFSRYSSPCVSGDVLETFDDYAVGTPGSDISGFFSSGDFFTGSVQAEGTNGSNGFCIDPTDQTLSWFQKSLSNDDRQRPSVGNTIKASVDLRFQNAPLTGNDPADWNQVVSLEYSAGASPGHSINAGLMRTGEDWKEVFIFLWRGGQFGLVNSITSSVRLVSDLGLDPNAAGEWTDYFSLELDVEHLQGGGGLASTALVDTNGNVLTSTTLDMPVFPINFATGDLPSPQLFANAAIPASHSTLCFDNFSHSVVPEPSTLFLAILCATLLATQRRRVA